LSGVYSKSSYLWFGVVEGERCRGDGRATKSRGETALLAPETQLSISTGEDGGVGRVRRRVQMVVGER
jgi:hypothetical protein